MDRFAIAMRLLSAILSMVGGKTMRRIVMPVSVLLILAGCNTTGGETLKDPQPAELQPSDYATIPSVVNRLKCDVLGELAKNSSGSAWHPKSIEGTIELSVVQAANIDGAIGFAIPVASAVTIDLSGEKEQDRSNTRKFTITLKFDENSPLDPTVCAGDATKINLVDHDGKRALLPAAHLVDFVNLTPMMDAVANISPKVAVKEVVYEGAFEIVKKTTLKGDVDFVIVKLGSASRLRSSDYTQSYKIDVTYSTDNPNNNHWFDVIRVGPPIQWPPQPAPAPETSPKPK